MITQHKKIYKKDSTDNTRVWWIESQDNKFRIHSGVLNGKIVESEWTICEPKNTGKKNATTAEQQCLLEVDANYKKKLAQGNYKETLETNSLNQDNYFKPMLAKEYGEDYTYVENTTVFSQPKIDGVRAIATKNGLFSRQGKPIISTPHISLALKPLFDNNPNLIFDGELYSDKLSDNFNEIISLARKSKPTQQDLLNSKQTISYWIYDLPSTIGGFEKRFADLQTIFNQFPQNHNLPLTLTQTNKASTQLELDQLYATYMQQNFEGQMIRQLNANYENKRTKQLIKRKEFKDQEFTIVSVDEGQGNWSGYAKSITVSHNNKSFSAGIAGNQSFTKYLLDNKHKLIGTLVTIKYQNLTPDGIPRFPVATKFWLLNNRTL